MREGTTKYNSNQTKKQVNRIFINEKLAINVIMDCRTTSTHKLRRRLGFKQYVILTKEQSALTKIMSSLEGENIQTQDKVLSYRINLYVHDYKLTIEIDGNEQSYRNIDYEITRQKAIEQELCCKFIRIGPDKEDFDIFRAINEDILNN